MALRSFFLRANKKVEENKKSYKEKAEDTKEAYSNLHEMQKYVDLSEEKRALLMDLVLHGRSSDSDESLLEKGVVIYCKYLDVIAQLAEDFKKAKVDCYVIQGSTKGEDRGLISQEFKKNPKSKVILISDAAGESLNLNSTNELVMYNVSAKHQQVLGRVARMFSHFEKDNRSFYIHYIIVEETLDEYKPILLSSRKQLEEEILHADMINLKEVKSFDAMLLKEIKKVYLWKTKREKKRVIS